MNGDEITNILETLAEFREKIRHLLEWEKEINLHRSEVDKKIQHYDDYCLGNEHLPDELTELKGWQLVVDKDIKAVHDRLKTLEKKSDFNEKWIGRFLALGFVISLILVAVNIYMQWMRSA